ncbi:diacylglycerol kinase [Ornithinibacillus sp. L9]|uniref:Diacylglycerol kinase n=1 Tax=Ornithinibacillus caprae TaxID=2678566 RepID=A0A6N8FFS0_9BACI|nr:diacylglycerol kinase family protein [Ornithinibacillus caprae]MUK87094.1 diacylglycerol kinase [Ornithinibacillus caprae]
MKGKHRIGFSYACNGIKEVFKSEINFRLHIISTIIVISAGLLFQLSPIEWAFIFFCIGIVLVAELLNSAIEKAMDYIKPEIHPTAKVIKDISAGAVLIAAITAAIIGTIIFLPKISNYF